MIGSLKTTTISFFISSFIALLYTSQVTGQACRDFYPQCKTPQWKAFCANPNIREVCQESCELCNGGGGGGGGGGGNQGWTNWRGWSRCTVTCGGGKQTRRRRCRGDESNCPGNSVQERECNTQDCPVIVCEDGATWCPGFEQQCKNNDYVVTTCPLTCQVDGCGRGATGWTEWTDWTDCSATCGDGNQERTRTCQGGSCPGEGYKSRSCQTQPCAASWTEWSDWGVCPVSCGGGIHRRNRTCNGGGCPGQNYQERQCETQPCPSVECINKAGWCEQYKASCKSVPYVRDYCPVSCGDCDSGDSTWSEWSAWSCDVTCGPGTESRTRVCEKGECPGKEMETRPCTRPTCDPDETGYGPWSVYGPCSDTCGGGVHARTRTCLTSKCTAHSQEIKNCNEQNCQDANCRDQSRDCEDRKAYGQCEQYATVRNQWCRKTCGNCGGGGGPSWGEYGPCRVTCGAGLKTRYKGSISQEITCIGPKCGTGPSWGSWGPYGDCSKTCGGGTQTRTRTCPVPGNCPGESTDSKRCNDKKCPKWSNWGQWGTCSTTCGPGMQKRTRKCSEEGKCEGSNEAEKECQVEECQFPEWTQWSEWGACSKSCAGGTRERKRKCTIRFKCGNLPGGRKETESCNTDPCASWSKWTPWTICSESCDGGDRKRKRKCSIEGKCGNLPGKSEEQENCNTDSCPKWLQWSAWSKCTLKCGSGKIKRTRTCDPPGKCDSLPGLSEEERACNTQLCSKWNEWGQWSDCSKSCGKGERTRTRTCDVANECEGMSEDSEECNTDECEGNSSWSTCSKTCGGGTSKRFVDGNWEFKSCGNGDCEKVTCNTYGLLNRYKDDTKCCPPKHEPAALFCGRNLGQRRIIGGVAAEEGKWPWIGALLGASGFCAGTLISQNYLISAAHCFVDNFGKVSDFRSYVFRFGIADLRAEVGYQSSQVEEVIPHPDYNYPYHDIAIVKLKSTLKYTDKVYPMCLPHGEITPFDTTCHVIGWGVSDIPDAITYKLQEVAIQNFDPGVCVEAYGKHSALRGNVPFLAGAKSYLCAGSITKKVDSCSGDSGGPLLCQRCESCSWYLAGVVSFGPNPCALEKTPAVYTKVVHYEDWIFEKTKLPRYNLECKKALRKQ